METTQSRTNTKIPLALKVGFTLFMLVLVPFYWQAYGPTNFLYFCDVSLFIALAALWTESPLLASIPAVGIVVPQLLWVLDFGTGLFGLHPIGMTDYMFRESIPLFARGLSLFHGWLPFLLLYLVHRLGYDRRAFAAWTALGWALMLVCYFFMPAPPAPAGDPNLPVNINYVFGPSDSAAQTWMAAPLYLLLMMVALPALLWAPAHFALSRFMKPARSALPTAAQPRVA
jgi:hypothetical protein